MLPRAASREKGMDDEARLLDGGSMRVNDVPHVPAVLRRLRIPVLLRTGDRPAGAESGEHLERLEACSGV